jgi:hypothetical protein
MIIKNERQGVLNGLLCGTSQWGRDWQKATQGQIFIGTLESATCINIISIIKSGHRRELYTATHRSSSSVVSPVTIPLGLSCGAALCVALQGRPELNLNSLRSRTIPTAGQPLVKAFERDNPTYIKGGLENMHITQTISELRYNSVPVVNFFGTSFTNE